MEPRESPKSAPPAPLGQSVHARVTVAADPASLALATWALDHDAWNASPLRAELAAPPCESGRYVLALCAQSPGGDCWTLASASLALRPCDGMWALVARFCASTGVEPAALRGPLLLHNDVSEWQVDPDEPHVTRAEGRARIAAVGARERAWLN